MEKWSWGANRYACVTMGAKSKEKPAKTDGLSYPAARCEAK